MQVEELLKLVHQLQTQKTESQNLEVKSAHDGCPTRLFGTLSAFSNQDTGGVIVFGLDERAGFSAVGVYDAHDLQKRVAEQCKQMEPIVRPLFTVAAVDGHPIVSAEIPSVDADQRPVYYRGVGRSRGSYIRVGESNEQMSEYEIYSFDAFRKRIRDDLRPVANARLAFFDPSRVERYLTAVKLDRRNIADSVSDEGILQLMGVTVDGSPTLAGLMSFSHYPQANFPQLCITAVVVPGTSMGETGDAGERFIANQRLTGPIPDMVETAVDFVRRNGRLTTVIGDDGKRIDKPEFPPLAVREAILNALVHRDYSIHSESVPVRIVMYSDRMEVTNSGGPYGNISIDSLGKVHPDTRNPTLANILELLAVTENRYSGIPTIHRECEKAKLPAPLFAAYRGEFIVTFRNNLHVAIKEAKHDQTAALLTFCSIPRSRDELTRFTGFSQYYTMSKIVQPLIDARKIRLTMPERPRSRYQRFVTI